MSKICKKCKETKHMKRLVDSMYHIYDQRSRICYKCAPSDRDLEQIEDEFVYSDLEACLE